MALEKRILEGQASLTAHWHDKGADWRGLAHTPAHHRSRLSDSDEKKSKPYALFTQGLSQQKVHGSDYSVYSVQE